MSIVSRQHRKFVLSSNVASTLPKTNTSNPIYNTFHDLYYSSQASNTPKEVSRSATMTQNPSHSRAKLSISTSSLVSDLSTESLQVADDLDFWTESFVISEENHLPDIIDEKMTQEHRVCTSLQELGIQQCSQEDLALTSEDDFLYLRVYDVDKFRNELIGTVVVPLRLVINDKSDKSVPVTPAQKFRSLSEKCGPFTIQFRCVLFPTERAPRRRQFFIIRHGQSKWNEAQAGKNFGKMLAFDHGLTQEGVEQAITLNHMWRSGLERYSPSRGYVSDPGFVRYLCSDKDRLYIEAFADVDTIFSSPLTRAIQTAVFSMKEHKALEQGIILSSVIREVKNVGGLDTVGKAFGGSIALRMIEESSRLELSDESQRLIETTRFEINDAVGPWWTSASDFDNVEQVDERIAVFLNLVRYWPSKVPLFVGHSLFFHAFCSKSLYPLFCEREPELAKNLMKYRLENGSMLYLEVDFPLNREKPSIVDAHLVHGGFHVK